MGTKNSDTRITTLRVQNESGYVDGYQCIDVEGETVYDLALGPNGGEPGLIDFRDMRDVLSTAGFQEDELRERHAQLLSVIQETRGQTASIHYDGSVDIHALTCEKALDQIHLTRTLVGVGGNLETSGHAVRVGYRGTTEADSHGVRFSNEFAGGRMSPPTLLVDGAYRMILDPEDQSPINISPWYSFQVWAENPETRSVTIDLVPQGFEGKPGQETAAYHRYDPKVSSDGVHWSRVPIDQIQYSLDLLNWIDASEYDSGELGKPMASRITLPVNGERLFVSAQELLTSVDARSWADVQAARPNGTMDIAGYSTEQRPIYRVDLAADETLEKETVVMIGGLHPPEVTGRLAFESFFDELASDTRLARQFRKHFAVKAYPMINPDGIDAGHWRYNTQSVDLNRDWHDFAQVESRVVKNDLFGSLSDNQVAAFVDFHSTDVDTLYFPNFEERRDLSSDNGDILQEWLNRFRELDPTYPAEPKKVPFQYHVSMNWAASTFDAPAFSIEMADEAPRDRIDERARLAARALMKTLLERR